jgi:hypothetical protein
VTVAHAAIAAVTKASARYSLSMFRADRECCSSAGWVTPCEA